MTQLLTLKKLEIALKRHNLRQMSEETLIPYNTLKNYSSGKTALDSIPYRYLEKISDYDNAKNYECFEVSNFTVSSEVFDELIKKHRKDYNSYYEYLHCCETFNKRVSEGNRHSSTDGKIYYFIDSDIFATDEYKGSSRFTLMSSLSTLLSIGLAMGIRIILRDNRYINRDEVVGIACIDLSDWDYDLVVGRLRLLPDYELNKLNEIIDKTVLKELVTRLEYIKSLDSLDDRVDKVLGSIDNITPDTFK